MPTDTANRSFAVVDAQLLHELLVKLKLQLSEPRVGLGGDVGEFSSHIPEWWTGTFYDSIPDLPNVEWIPRALLDDRELSKLDISRPVVRRSCELLAEYARLATADLDLRAVSGVTPYSEPPWALAAALDSVGADLADASSDVVDLSNFVVSLKVAHEFRLAFDHDVFEPQDASVAASRV